MDRIADAEAFIADAAVTDWATLWQSQQASLARAHRAPMPGQPRPRDVQVRWYVSKNVGAPPMPFTVWRRRDKDSLLPLAANQVGDVVRWGGVPMFTLALTCTPIDPSRPCALWGFRRHQGLRAAVGVSRTALGLGPHRLTVRAGSMTSARLVNAQLVSAEATTVDAVINHAAWDELEIVGLPYDPNAWNSLDYRGEKQGMVSSLTSPFDAAVERLKRAAPEVGWWPITESGHSAPPWELPDFGGLVKEVQNELLPHLGPLFQPGLTTKLQRFATATHNVDPPTQDGRVAVVDSSRMLVPLLGTLQLAAGTDPYLAMAAGFGTGYPYDPERRADQDLMITASYPKGIDGSGAIEYAWPIPAPESHAAMAAPSGFTATRAGLIDPVLRDTPWRETVALDWQALPASFFFPRAAAAAAARFDPTSTADAVSLLEKRASGGWRPLAPVRRPEPHTDQVRLVDVNRPLPMDGTTVTTGYAVAQQDQFGIWSPWKDGLRTAVEPGQPTPALGHVAMSSTYAGTPQCATDLDMTLTLDWLSRTPSFVQLAVSIFPAAYNGAPTPAGVGPFSAVAGGQQITITFRFNGDQPISLTPGCTVDWIAQHTDDLPAPMADLGDETRRYRVRMAGLTLNFAATNHFGAAVWARELSAGHGTWGPLSPTPVRGFASSPVPIIVPSVPLPIVPLGSLPDAEGRSHVSIRLTGLPGAAKLIVWTATEIRIRQAAGLGPIPSNESLSQRFVAAKVAFNGLSQDKKQNIFSRLVEVLPGAASTDVTIPRGNHEINFYVATGRTQAGLESPWPTTVDQLQAAAAPSVISPSVPELSAAFVSPGGLDRIGLSMSVRSNVAVQAFEIHRTYKSPITASTSMMGPTLASVAATLSVDPATPAGVRYEAAFVDPSAGDWRTAHYRVVAVPTLSVTDQNAGRLGRRSPDSSLSSLLLPPSSAPDLTLIATSEWGTLSDGVLIRVSTDAPVDASPLGAFSLRCDALTTFAADVDAIAIASTVVPPATVTNGTFTRTVRSAGRAEIAMWFRRPTPQVPVNALVTLTDPLGRARTVPVAIPADPLTLLPVITIIGTRLVGPMVVVSFALNAPTATSPAGDWTLGVRARRTVSPPLGASLVMTVPSIPDVGTLPPNTPGRLILARQTVGTKTSYLLGVRIARPFRLQLVLTDLLGRTASFAQVFLPGPL